MTDISGLAPAGAHPLHHATGQEAFVKSKWQLLRVVEQGREALGLKGTSIALLRAMLSLIRSDQLSHARDADHICFASNARLAERTHVSVQTVERHISLLVACGLIQRRASGNGKRWARRDRAGQIVTATGLSLLPLLERHSELSALVARFDAERERLAALRDQCLIALGQLVETAQNRNRIAGLKARARNLFRRKPEGTALQELLASITSESGLSGASDAEESRGIDTENEGQKETSLNQSFIKKKNSELSLSPAAFERAYPTLCAELRSARGAGECERRLGDIARYLHLGETWFELQKAGPTCAFMVLGYVLERIGTVRSPRAYAMRLLQDWQADRLELASLLKPVEYAQ